MPVEIDKYGLKAGINQADLDAAADKIVEAIMARVAEKLDDLPTAFEKQLTASAEDLAGHLTALSKSTQDGLAAIDIPDHRGELEQVRRQAAELNEKWSAAFEQALNLIARLEERQAELVEQLKRKRKYTYTFERDYHDRVTGATIEES